MKNLNIKRQFIIGYKLLNDQYYIDACNKTLIEKNKKPLRSDVINFLLESKSKSRQTNYLEIGVRDPDANFNKISSNMKISVDPGVEFKSNPVDFKMTSDEFFDNLKQGKILSREIKFDVIFIDGLHLAEQVERDISNALSFICDDGFIVLHDCNPPTEYHARDNYEFRFTPAKGFWNGTTWKAFFKYRKLYEVFSCCIDTDWGVGIISKKINIGMATSIKNDFYDFYILDAYRKESLNLIDFDKFKENFK